MTSKTLRAFALIAAALPLFAAAPASAQDEGGHRWTVTVGGGAQLNPRYPGADNYGIFPLPIVGIRREGTPMPFAGADDSFGFGVLGRGSAFNFGPAVRLQNKRDEEDVGAAVGDVGTTIEVGGFAQVYLGDNVRLRVEGRKGLGGHDAWLGDIGADFVAGRGGQTLFAIGPRARIANGRYHDAYFGVTPAVATATGLPAFNPGGGFYAIGAVTSLTQRVGRNWGVYGFAGYDRLIRDAADSPIVRTLGSRDQFSGGVGLYVEFGAGRR